MRSQVAAAFDRFVCLETKYDRRILVSLALAACYLTAWLLLKSPPAPM